MSTSRIKVGFTLIELMIVIVIVGLLAAIAIPKFTDSRARAYIAAQRSDLANLAMQQEIYFFNNRAYAVAAGVVGVSPSNGVTLAINEASGTGWSAATSHASTAVRCGLFYGTAAVVAPAVAQGVINCE